MGINRFKKLAKKPPIETIPEDEECQLYTLMCIKSASMLHKFVKKYGDDGRRVLLEVKYKLSNCPLTYGMIRDIVQDSSNWVVEKPAGFSSVHYRIEDKRNHTGFTLFNHSKGIDRGSIYDKERKIYSKFETERIKLYYRSEHELFCDNEKVIVAKVLWTYTEMLKNLEELKRQQKIMKDSDKLRGLY